MASVGIEISNLLGDAPSWLMSNEEAEAYDMEERRRKIREKLSKSGIPERYTSAKLEDCAPEVASYASDRGNTWLVINGDNGTGKTHQACAVGIHFIEQELCNVRFASMGRILAEIRETYRTGDSTEAIFAKYANCRLLIVDDFGKEKPTESSVALFFRIINSRYERRLATVFTTNLSEDELLDSLVVNGNAHAAMAITDRMADAENTFVRLGGRSRRRLGGKGSDR